MKKLCLILINVLALVPAGWCAYADKEDTNTNYIAEPVLAPGTAAAQKPEGDYRTTETRRTNCCPTATLNPTTVTGSRA